MMSEKRFQLDIGDDYCFINDKIENKTYAIYNDRFKERWGQEIVDLLNEQQDTIGEQKIAIDELITDYKKLEKENEQLRKIGVMYQGHNPCESCTYCLEDKLCCGINPPILCDEMKKDYFIYGLCKKHKQIQKSIRRYDDE